jgi:hypothetical protein
MIDVNTCAGNWVFRPLSESSPESLYKRLKAEGIDKAFVSPIEGIFYDEPQLANEKLFGELKNLPFFLPVAVLNPKLANWEKSLNSCCNYNIRAIKLYPNYHRYNLDDNDAIRLITSAGERDITIIVQLRVQDTRAQNPLCIVSDVDIANVIKAAGMMKTRFVIGGIKWNEAQNMTKQTNLPNVWMEISNIEYVDVLRRLINLYGTNQILFGTHAPFFVIRSAILKLKEACLTEHEHNSITNLNAIEAFHLR